MTLLSDIAGAAAAGPGGWLAFGLNIIEKIVGDPAAKQAAQLELLKLQQSGELAQLAADTDLAKAQAAINQTEAASPDFFRGGWRPFVGWVCGFGLAYDFVARPLLAWAGATWWNAPPPPALELDTLLPLLAGLLGLGGMRTAERINGVIPKGL